MNLLEQIITTGMFGTFHGLMMVKESIYFVGQAIAMCQDNNNKIIVTKAENGAFLKAFLVTEEIAFGCSNGFVGILNLKSKRFDPVKNFHSPGVPIKAVQFNSNDSYLASSSMDGLISIICLADSSITQMYDADRLTCMKFSIVKSSILATAYESGKIVIWDIASSTRKLELTAHQNSCSGFAFSPVNHLLVCSCGLDGKIQFYDIGIGKNVKTIDAMQPLSSIAFCGDGHTISVGTIKGKILIYDLKDKQRLKYELKGQEGKKINALHFQRLMKNDNTSKPSSLQIIQSSQTLAINRTSYEKPKTSGTTLHEVQNTTTNLISTQQQKPLIKASTSKMNSLLGTPNSSQKNLNTTKLTQEQQTLKFLEEQKLDQTKKQLETQLKAMQIDLNQKAALAKVDTQSTLATNSVRTQQPSFQLNLNNLQQLPNSKPQLYTAPIEEEDEEMLNSLRINPVKPKTYNLNPELKQHIEQQIDEKMEEHSAQLQSVINQLHVELIRNFQLQEEDLRESMEKVAAKNKRRRIELRRLREENQKLRQISY